MLHRSKIAIIGLLALCALAAGYATWYRYQKGDRSMEFWGTKTVLLIRKADQIEVLLLGDAEESTAEGAEQLVIEGRKRVILQSKDLQNGGLKMRNALVEDHSFAWDQPRDNQSLRWRYGLRLSNAGQQAILAFDLDNARVRLVQSEQEVSVQPIIIGLKRYFKEHFPSVEGAEQESSLSSD